MPIVAAVFLLILPLDRREFIANLRANWRHNFRGLAPYLTLGTTLLILSVIIFLWLPPVDLVELMFNWGDHILWIVDFLLSALGGLVLWIWVYLLSRKPKKWTIEM